MPTRPLGRTGHDVSLICLGGQAALAEPDNEDVANAVIERALDLGVNYIDTAPRYGKPDRWSERNIAGVMKRRRREVYLASKTHDRTRDGSLRLLDESLRTLGVETLDAWQLHFVTTMDDVEQIFAPGGAIEALQRARDEKLVRFLGVTGHADPHVLMECLRRFPFDQILLAVNAADPFHMSFQAELLPMAHAMGIGIVGMKATGRKRLLASWKPTAQDREDSTGFTLLPGTFTIKDALDYTLTLPLSSVAVGCDNVAGLEEAVAVALAWQPLGREQVAAMNERARPLARQALFFRRWP
ncbi:MAG: aldo/keto reductase [Myxococcota bacterium]|nr:aldo/keto reductase [Myxococcota bacterium]